MILVLGLRFWGVVLALILAPIFSFFIRRRWGLESARREEIRRLMIMASEETARVEYESIYEYKSLALPPSQIPQCVVCYTPTSKFCSRCKAVRYCSGTCQIIHWRQGHKEQCHPITSGVQFNALGSILQEDQTGLGGRNLEGSNLGERSQNDLSEHNIASMVTPLQSSSFNSGFKDDSEVKATEIDPPSPRNDHLSSNCNLEEAKDEVAINKIKASNLNTTHIEEPLSDDISSKENTNDSHPEDGHTSNIFSSAKSIQNDQTKHRVKVVDDKPSYSSTSSFHFVDETVSESSAPSDVGFMSSVLQNTCHDDSNRSNLHQDVASLKSNSESHVQFSKNSDTKIFKSSDAYRSSSFRVMPSHKAFENAVSSNKSYFEQPEKSITRSLSFNASSFVNRYYNGSTSPFSRTTSSTSDNVCAPSSSNLSTSASFYPSNDSILKKSVQKVVKQLKISKHAEHLLFDFGRSTTRKYNYQMLFPYDHFLKLYSEKVDSIRPFGLVNCGNSCFANVVLQCLAFTRPLTAYHVKGLHIKTCLMKEWCFSCEFETLLAKARQGKSPISPIKILSHLPSIGCNLGHGREEDAHEFLRYAIDAMQMACIKESGANAGNQLIEETTLIQLTFGGYLLSKIKCMKCLGKSERRERMMDLTVEIDGDVETLEKALKRFTQNEILDGENKYQCGRCKSYEKAQKKLTILEAPNILTIVLKRFQGGKFGKINKPVKFEECLTLTPFMWGDNDKSAVYTLYGVIVHLDVMNATSSGHYVCYVKHDSKWFKIDDSVVKQVDAESVLAKNAYMLLYARVSPRAPSSAKNLILSMNVKHPESNSLENNNDFQEQKSSSASSTSTSTSPCASYLEAPKTSKSGLSSDSFSLFTSSEEGSCTTDSSRDSLSTVSTVESSPNNRWRNFEDSDDSPCSTSSKTSWKSNHLQNLKDNVRDKQNELQRTTDPSETKNVAGVNLCLEKRKEITSVEDGNKSNINSEKNRGFSLQVNPNILLRRYSRERTT